MTERKRIKKGRYFIGEVGVDSGMVMIIDPCYIKGIKSVHSNDNWKDFCEICSKSGIFETGEPFEIQGGIVSSNHIGDGGFPVYGTFDNDGRVSKLEVLFHWTNDRDRSRTVEWQND